MSFSHDNILLIDSIIIHYSATLYIHSPKKNLWITKTFTKTKTDSTYIITLFICKVFSKKEFFIRGTFNFIFHVIFIVSKVIYTINFSLDKIFNNFLYFFTRLDYFFKDKLSRKSYLNKNFLIYPAVWRKLIKK